MLKTGNILNRTKRNKIEYDYRYKHLRLIVGGEEIIIELSKDTMLKETTYSAKSNLLFFDADETWGRAVGVGSNEQAALDMCLKEIKNYLKCEFVSNFKEVDLPQKFTYIYKRKTIILYFEQNGNNFSILTPKGRKEIVTDSIVDYITKNPKEFKNDSVDNYSPQLFNMYNFSEPFDAKAKKYAPNGKAINLNKE